MPSRWCPGWKVWKFVRPSESHKNWLQSLTDRYHGALTKEVRSYLKGRGLGKAVVDGNLLGLVIDPDPAHVRYEGWLSIPFITPTGVVQMRFRCLEDHGKDVSCDDLFHGKYEGVKGDETRLYNVLALHQSGDTVGICEGELDALAATKAGLPTVGVTGVNNWKSYYYRLLDDYETVVVMGDGDTYGREFVATLAPNIPGSVRRPFPDGHDVTTFILEHGVDTFKKFVGLNE